MQSTAEVRGTVLTGVRRVIAVLTLALLVAGAAASAAAAESTPPVDETPPGISGTAALGDILEATHGTWSGSEPISYTYQWERCDKVGCQPIYDATSTHHTVVWEDVGMKLAVKVSAENEAGHASATSAETALVPGGPADVGWGNNYPAEQLGSQTRISFELAPGPVLGIEGVKQAAVATDSSYVLLAGGTVKSWGGSLPGTGPLGYGSFRKTPIPQTVVEENQATHELHTLEGVTQIAAAGEHVMALLEDGEVETWGSSAWGARGNGEFGNCLKTLHCFINGLEYSYPEAQKKFGVVPRDVAIKVPGLHEVVAVAVAGSADYAVLKDGRLESWGANLKGMLGIGVVGTGKSKGPKVCDNYPCNTTPALVCMVGGVAPCEPGRTAPHGILEGVTAVAGGAEVGTGEGAVYAVANGDLVAWGDNHNGQLGIGKTSETERAAPAYVDMAGIEREGVSPGEQQFLAVAGGADFGLALLADGRVIGWGAGGAGQISGEAEEPCNFGKAPSTCQKEPKLVSGLHEVTEIAAGSGITFALSGRSVKALGNAERGQLGNGSAEETPRETCGTETECLKSPGTVVRLGPSKGRPVGQVVAGSGPTEGEAHSFATLESGTPPLTPIRAIPGAETLQLVWDYGNASDKVKWRRVPPEAETAEREEKIEVLIEEKRNYKNEEAFWTEEAATATGEERVHDEEKAKEAEEKVVAKEEEVKTAEANLETWEEEHTGKWQLGKTGETRECTEASTCSFTVTEYEKAHLASTWAYELKVEVPKEADRHVVASPLP